MVVALITLLSLFYYQNQEKLMLLEQRAELTRYAYVQTKRLRALHEDFEQHHEYPHDARFKSAIYDLEQTKIFSLLEDENVQFDTEEIYTLKNHIHLVKTLDEYYLGTYYLIIEVKKNASWSLEVWKNIVSFGLAAFVFFMLFGFYLAKLFVKPMRNSIVLLDRFIKDTTHELNTPLSAILANIDMMQTDVMIEKNKTKLKRIHIAAKMLSVLYKDLTYITFEAQKKNEDEAIDLKTFLEDRLEYFSVLAHSKNIKYALEMTPATIHIDKGKLTRIIDNLLSNAIKYNKRNGTLGIRLKQNTLTIWDTGRGIEKDQIPFIFDRYMRFDKSEGGFGVGLSIVKHIVDEYHIVIKVDSSVGKGTSVTLQW
jgi:two-component system OmpR family sensor kinase